MYQKNATTHLLCLASLLLLLGNASAMFPQDAPEDPVGEETVKAVESEMVEVRGYAADSQIEKRITGILASTEWFRELNVESSNGIVTIRGVAQTDQQRDWAGNLVARTQDVAAVKNEIQVDSQINIAASWSIVAQSLESLCRDMLMRMPFVVIGIFVLLLTWAAAWLTRAITSAVLGKSRLRTSLRDLLELLATLGIWIAGLLIAAVVVFPGMTPSKALAFLGIGSVAIGFAFKDIFENFFAGVLILWRYPLDRGDLVQIGETIGRVELITVRNTMLRRLDGELTVVPNGTIFKSKVDVLTNRSLRRLELQVGIAYGEDVDDARKVIETTVQHCVTVDQSRPHHVLAKAFGASSIDFDVIWWSDADPLKQRESRDEVVTAIKSALDREGIEIPFPYRTLTFKEPLSVSQTEDVSNG